MFGLPGGMEWIIIGLIALLIFGKRLPEVMRSVGKGISEFKHGMQDVNEELPNLTDVGATTKPIDPPHDSSDYDAKDEFEDDEPHEEDLNEPGEEEESDEAKEQPAEGAEVNDGKDMTG